MIVDFLDRARVVAHETGHAIVAWSSPFVSVPQAIRFFPAHEEAEVEIVPLPEVTSTLDALEVAAFALGGAAGEAHKLGAYERLVLRDLDTACLMAAIVYRWGMRRRRRLRVTPFMRTLPEGVWRELHWFVDKAYEHALGRLQTHQEAYDRLHGFLSHGYLQGRIEFTAAELAQCLGPKPKP